MKLIEKNENQIIFGAEIEDSVVNAIRRYVGHIPVLAVDELEISRNDSPLYDETIAHRIGLVPIRAEKGDEKSKIKLEVKREGSVYSGDMKGVDIVYKTIPLTTLDKGQELELTATLKFGLGSQHAKFSPGLMFYRNAVEITMDKELLDEVQAAAPSAEIKEKGGKIIIEDNGKVEVADVLEGIAQKRRKKAEVVAGKDMIVTVESFGQLEPKEIFKGSIDALKKDLNAVTKAIDKAL